MLDELEGNTEVLEAVRQDHILAPTIGYSAISASPSPTLPAAASSYLAHRRDGIANFGTIDAIATSLIIISQTEIICRW